MLLHSMYEWFEICFISAYLSKGNNCCKFVKSTFKSFSYLRCTISMPHLFTSSSSFILWSFPPIIFSCLNPLGSLLGFRNSGTFCPGKPSRCNFFNVGGKSLYLVSDTPHDILRCLSADNSPKLSNSPSLITASLPICMLSLLSSFKF